SRIETPTAKKPNAFSNKILPQSPSIDDSNITLKSPYSEVPSCKFQTGTLEQRVAEFEKSAKNMMARLDKTKERIEKNTDGERGVEDLKMLIAPDAATLISQGDSLVLETHGKQGSLSRVVMRSQIILREKFREVQQSKSKALPAPKDCSGSPYSSLDKVSMKGVNLEELICKGLKRVNDLIARPVDRKSSEDLEKRLSEIN
uniref:Uncharacterized protein n=2 Tax=Stomoxys calcitrans TaxID=35570 RepID=A0A1I8P3L5_STOCA